MNALSTPCLQHCADNNGMCPVHVQVYGMTDEDGVSLNDPLQPDTRKHGRAGDGRTLKVHEANTHALYRYRPHPQGTRQHITHALCRYRVP